MNVALLLLVVVLWWFIQCILSPSLVSLSYFLSFAQVPLQLRRLTLVIRISDQRKWSLLARQTRKQTNTLGARPSDGARGLWRRALRS